MHTEDMAVHWGLQRTSDTSTEEWGQNKLVNYSSQSWTTNIWRMETLKWTRSASEPWNDFLSLGSARSTAFQSCWKHLSRTLWACSKSGTLGWYRVVILQPRALRWLRSWEWLLPLCLPFPKIQELRKKILETIITPHFPLIPCPSIIINYVNIPTLINYANIIKKHILKWSWLRMV